MHCALPPALHAAYSRAAVRAELIGALLAAANPPVRSINIRLLTAEERALLDHAAAVLGAYSITFRQVGGAASRPRGLVQQCVRGRCGDSACGLTDDPAAPASLARRERVVSAS